MAHRNNPTLDAVVHGTNAAGDTFPLPLKDDGSALKAEIENISLTIDATGLASSAKQDTGNTSLASIKTDVDKIPSQGAATSAASTPVVIATDDAMIKALRQPKQCIAVTPSDATDITATATKGLLVTVSGVVNVTYVGDSVAVGLGTLPVGTYIAGELKRVNAATTATVVSFYG